MGKAKQLSQDLRKKTKNCGLPQVWFLQAVISIFVLVCKSKNLGSTQTLHCSGNWHRCTPRDELNLIRKVHQQPKPATKELVMVFEASSTNTLLNLQMITSLIFSATGGEKKIVRLLIWRTLSRLWSMGVAGSFYGDVLLGKWLVHFRKSSMRKKD